MSSEALAELSERVFSRADPDDAPALALVLADAAMEAGDAKLVAAALDRAWGLTPHDEGLAQRRAQALDALELHEHGLRFRYVPAGHFLMGSTAGDLDEQPVHAVRTAGFWMTDVPVSWAAYARLMDWEPPPFSRPRGLEGAFMLAQENRIRAQYCESQTLKAVDWHAHVGMKELGEAPRREQAGPIDYEQKPMVAVSWQEAEELGRHISTLTVRYELPTEAEWERAARGGLIGKRYSWGDERPDGERCDFGHFGEFVIRPPRELPPNGYGLHGVCGGVWEWTADSYDALAYHPRRPDPAQQPSPRVLRGGSFTDDEAAVTVSFRMSLRAEHWAGEGRGNHDTPNVGFRLLRREGSFGLSPPRPELIREPVVRPPLPDPTPPPPKRSLWARLLGAGKK